MLRLDSFEPTADNVAKVIELFKINELSRLNQLWAYYDNVHQIGDRVVDDGKPNNKLAHGYCKYITDTITGYFMGINVKYSSDDEQYLRDYTEIINDNFEDDENFELAKKASIFGYGVEIVYQNEKAQTRCKRVDPREMILIFGSRLDSYLLCAIRLYEVKTLDNKLTEYADVYTSEAIIHYSRPEGQTAFVELERESHYFNEVPVVVYSNNEEMRSDFEQVMTLVDAYDKAQSDSANDFEYFTDAYLVFSNCSGFDGADDNDVEGTSKAYANLRRNRLLFLGENGSAHFLTKEINDAAIENYKNRLNSDVHKFGMVPDLSDKEFAGNLSGIAIKFKILPLEQKVMIKENKFRTALAKRREMITTVLNIRKGSCYDYRDISEEFTRNLPQNVKEDTETILMLDGVISKRTLLELLPQIDDVDQELNRLEEEQAADDLLGQYDQFLLNHLEESDDKTRDNTKAKTVEDEIKEDKTQKERHSKRKEALQQNGVKTDE